MTHVSPPTRVLAIIAASALAGAIGACADTPTSPSRVVTTARQDQLGAPQNEPPAPGGLVTETLGAGSLTFWPFTGDDFGERVADPINAVFTGYVDPLRLRAALRRLDGNRTPTYPASAPFNCTWRDAIGDEQTAFAEPEQWTGSAVQLQCGEYGPLRFHVRFFGQGPSWTIAGTHFEVNIPGTETHRVLSWKVARDFLTTDLIRSGILAAGSPGLSSPITPTPTFGKDLIEVAVYNSLPVALRALIGGPLGNVSEPQAVLNDGRASLFVVDKVEPIVPDATEQDFVLQFGQTIPKPFCNDPPQALIVTGPLHYQATARVTPDGIYERMHSVRGELDVIPLVGGEPGPAQVARIFEVHEGSITPAGALARMSSSRRLFKTEAASGDILSYTLHAGTRGHDEFRRVETCDR